MKGWGVPLLFLAFASSVEAYPIFFACDSNGRARDVLTTKEIQAKVLAALAAPGGGTQEINEICKGEAECFSVLKQALLLTQDSLAAANAIYEEEVAKIEATLTSLEADLKVDRSISSTAKGLVVMANSVNECRKAQIGLDPGMFYYEGHPATDSTNGLDVFVQSRIDNEYLFVSGIGKTDDRNRQIDYDQIGTVIRDAVASNVDPYMALSVAMMEAGKPEPFALDLAPSVEMIGCPLKKIGSIDDNNTEAFAAKAKELRASGQPFFYSWGTFYSFTPKVSEGGSTGRLYSQMQKAKSAESAWIISDEPGYACVQNEGAFVTNAKGQLVQSFNDDYSDSTFQKSKACCMKIPYLSSRVFTAMANTAMGDRLKGGGGDPAMTIQGFNGYGVIGMTEKKGVGAFRYGMRMRDYPQYGAQAMDFLLNSFMTNPLVRTLVEKAESDYGNRPKHILCSGKTPGTYAVDSEKYVNQQKAMKRLTTVIGKEWGEMSGLERALIRHEYGFLDETWIGLHPATAPAVQELKNAKTEAAKWAIYRTKIYPERNTLGKTSLKSWKRLEDRQILEMRRKIMSAPAQR